MYASVCSLVSRRLDDLFVSERKLHHHLESTIELALHDGEVKVLLHTTVLEIFTVSMHTASW